MKKIDIAKLARNSIKKSKGKKNQPKKVTQRREGEVPNPKTKITLKFGNPDWQIARAEGRVVGLPIKPGQVLNPSGRPKNLPIASAMKKHLAQPYTGARKDWRAREYSVADALAAKQIEIALDGDMRAAEEVSNRTEGKVPNPTTLSGPNGGPIDISAMTPEEKAIRIAELSARMLSAGE